MPKEKQLSLPLFDLSPRDKGKKRIDLSRGGLAQLRVKNFKGIHDLTVKFDPTTLLVGSNNSGKSTLLQAIRLFYYCIETCGIKDNQGRILLKKQVMPFSDFTLLPAHHIRELVTNGVTPSSKKYGIYLCGELRSGRTFDSTIYSAYSILLVILPGEASPKIIRIAEYDSISRQPLYVPGFSGVVPKELLSTNKRVEDSLGSG